MAQETTTNLEEFVQRLVEEKGLDNLDDEVLAQVKHDLMERAENRINAAILAEMPVDKIDEFSSLLDSGDAPTIQQFCAANIPHLDALIGSELLKFRETYIGA